MRRSIAAITCHCSAALSTLQRAISSSVRKQPAQYPRSSSEQTFTHGEGGRRGAAAQTSDIAHHYEAGSARFNLPHDSLSA